MIEITEDNQLKKIIIIGDKVLIKPKNPMEKTHSGLFLPPTVHEKQEVRAGYVIKTGPGYALPSPNEDEPWKEEKIKYLPLQAQEGDLALFLKNQAIEIQYRKETFFIVPHHALLLLERDEDLV